MIAAFRILRSTANVDSHVVTPGGVWVIDTKRYVGRAPEKRVEGGTLRLRPTWQRLTFVGARA